VYSRTTALGVSPALQRRYDEAEMVFREYLERDPTAATAVVDLGLLRLQQRRYADAIPFLRRALAMAPRYPGLRLDLEKTLREQAIVLAREGKQSEADGLLSEAKALSSRPAPPSGDSHRSTTTTLK
jgi:tetratricopeptide (TPR) repeat protein